MKRTSYPTVFGFVIALVFATTLVNAQTYRISFPSTPPTDFSAGGPVDQNDATGQGIETGVKFYVTQPGTITGIFFYRSTFNTGAHIGHIWDNSGTLLLTSSALPEVGNGWQERAVSLHINAGTVYVASIFNSVGDYALTDADFSGGTDYGTSPIKVLATLNDPASIGNGVYIYTNAAAFPNNSSNAPNYWIDIRFQPDFPLPVVLSDFKAVIANDVNAQLTWKTESEYNSKGFEIQRSNNGADWYPISFVNGAGESTTTRSYSYLDKNLAPGTYFYRLRQIDYDGKETFSGFRSLTISGKGVAALFQNYPNPFSGTSSIRYDLPKTQKVKLSIFDMLGREVQVLVDKSSEIGSHVVPIDGARLQRQMYLVKLQTEDGNVYTKTILVQ